MLFFEVLIWALTLRDYKLKENSLTKKAPKQARLREWTKKELSIKEKTQFVNEFDYL